MKAFAFGRTTKALHKPSTNHKRGGPRPRQPHTEERDDGTMHLNLHRAALVPPTESLDLSENALGILFAHRVLTSQERRAGDLWAIGRARDAGSVHAKIGLYEERIPDGYDGAPLDPAAITKSIKDYREGRKLLQGMGSRVLGEVWGAAIESRLPGWFRRLEGLDIRPSDGQDQQFMHQGFGALIELYEVS